MANLGSLYEKGNGVPKDSLKAVDWYRKAADLGEQHAEQALRRLGLTQ